MMHLFTHNVLKMKEKGYLIYEAKEGFHSETPLGGLRGTKIEPLVPLLTFIGDIDLDKEVENERVVEKGKKEKTKPTLRRKKKGLHL